MYNQSYYSSYGSTDAEILAAAGGILAVYSVIILAIAVVELIGMWKMFTKAGEAGWKCLIPIYNLVILFKIAGLSPWLILCYLLSFIPVVGWLVMLGLQIYLAINLSKSFGMGNGFAAGLFFLQPIFMCILGFGKAEYKGAPATAEAE